MKTLIMALALVASTAAFAFPAEMTPPPEAPVAKCHCDAACKCPKDNCTCKKADAKCEKAAKLTPATKCEKAADCKKADCAKKCEKAEKKCCDKDAAK